MKRLAFSLTIMAFFMIGCTESTYDDLGPYYELTFTDSAFAVVSTDSVHVILTQVPISLQVKEIVPFQTVDVSTIGDTIKFTLDVLFGSYSQTPNPQKSISIRQDSVLFWYAHIPGPPGGFPKTGATSMAQTSPKPTYYSVQSILIRKHPSKNVSFKSTLYH